MSLEKAKEEIENLSKEKEALIELSTEKDNKIKQLELELTRYKMARWGQSTEKIKDDPNQLNLFEDKDTIHKENEIEEIEITKSVKTKPRQIREKNPTWKNLPIQEIIRDPEEKNDPRYEYAGNEISYKLAVVSEKVYVKKIIRNKYALKKNLQGSESVKNLSTVVIAPTDSTPIPKSMADASLLSDIILQKYVYHMPFYRISKKYKNMGVDISPSTIGDWFAKVCELFRPLYKLLNEQVLSTDYIQIDETTLPVIDDEKHRARKGYIWAVNDPIHKNVFFYYDRGSRATYVAQHLLVDFNGAVQSDGYYEKLTIM